LYADPDPDPTAQINADPKLCYKPNHYGPNPENEIFAKGLLDLVYAAWRKKREVSKRTCAVWFGDASVYAGRARLLYAY
jgi:hypothetical protein